MIVHCYTPPYKDYFVAAFPMQDVRIQREMRTWCYNTFGEPGYRVTTDEVRWLDEIAYGEVRFSRESDLAMFLLRWE